MAKCKDEGCGADIVWASTEKGARIPLERVKAVYELEHDDADPETPKAVKMPEDRGNGFAPLYISHFLTCPGRKRFSGQSRRQR